MPDKQGKNTDTQYLILITFPQQQLLCEMDGTGLESYPMAELGIRRREYSVSILRELFVSQ